MLIVGLIGGIASGKSRIAELFQTWGAVVLDADRIGHQILQDPAVKQAIQQRWGNTVFSSTDEVDRKQLARIVFQSGPVGESSLNELERLVHPGIKSEIMRQLEIARKQGCTVVILDAPLLIEAGWDTLCNEILYIDAPRHKRLERAIQRGWSEEDFDRRERSQTPLDIKCRKSTRVLDNSGEWTRTVFAARELWENWTGNSLE